MSVVSGGYPNIFDPGNCSLISQLLPANAKKFLFDFMNGQAFRNPISQVAGLLKDQLGVDIARSDLLADLSVDLGILNNRLKLVNDTLTKFLAHTNRLSGLDSNDIGPKLDQIIGVMSAYNSIKDLLKDPGQLLEDNFSNAFSSLNPKIVGPFFENFGQNMNEISRLLLEIQNQTGGDDSDVGQFAGQLRQLSGNILAIKNNMDAIMNSDNSAFALALAFVERYALGNSLISTVLTDPCFGAQLAKNLITNPDFSKGLDDIAKENNVEIEGSPINLLDLIPSLNGSSGGGGTGGTQPYGGMIIN